MSQVRRTMMRGVALALALGGLGAWAIAPAQAGDLGGPVYGPAPYPAPNYGPVYERGGPCRIVLDRRVDPYGREIVHRMRVCDEGPVYPSAEGPVVAPEYGYPAPRYYGPQPSGYSGYYAYPPRPPAPIGPAYYD
jgi:hypothetical protein